MTKHTVPAENQEQEAAARHLILTSHFETADGATWAWTPSGYMMIVDPWAVEDHIGPIAASESFGDVESWAAYINRFALRDYPPHLTWSSRGLHAIIDYHAGFDGPDRCQWNASHPFILSPEWRAWISLEQQGAITQKAAIDFLDDHYEDITHPVAGDLLGIMRVLKAHVSTEASMEYAPDGGTAVDFKSKAAVRGGVGNDVVIPSEIIIKIPVLIGHTQRSFNDAGKEILQPVTFRVVVKARPTIASGDNPRLVFRFSIPNAERILEAVYADRVAAAKAALGDGFQLLRAAECART